MDSLLNLFWSFFKVGSFSFGGAYSLIPIIENEIVNKNNWLTSDEFFKVLGLVEVFPGAISIKFATYTGYKTAGILGVVAANLGNIITPAVVISVAAYFYFKFEKISYFSKGFEGIKFAVIGIILAILFKYTFKSDFNSKSFLFITAGFILIYFANINPIFVIIFAAILGVIFL